MWERKDIYGDPALNNEFKIMRELLQEKDKKIQKLEEELKGSQFGQNTAPGKKLIDKCKMLQDQNEELGKEITDGVIQNYKMEIAEYKKKIAENVYEMHKLKEENAEFKKDNIILEDTIESYKKILKETKASNAQMQKEIENKKEKALPKS